jgi:hypothetical protein
MTYTVRFEVLTAVVMKSSIFWDITPCSMLKSTDVSEKLIASIFRVEKAERDSGVKECCKKIVLFMPHFLVFAFIA